MTDTEDELRQARVTIDHMSQAMSWICGHDRQGLDHLAEAQREARGREAAVRQAQAWAKRARIAEADLELLRPQVDRLGDVQGRCPACGTGNLFVGEGGYITCALDTCPEPDAASTLLEHAAPPAETEQCHIVQVDGAPVRITGAAEMTDQEQGYTAEIVRAARRRYAAEHGKPTDR